MNENPTDGTINNTPPAEPAPTTPNPIPPAEPTPITPEPVPQVEPTPAPDQPLPPVEPSQKSVVNKPLVIVLVVILVALLGTLAYFLFFQNKSGNGQVPENTDTRQVEEEEEEEVPEITIEDQDTISALFRKLLILHHPQIDNYLSYATEGDSYSANKYFSFGSAYVVSDQLYSDGLTNRDKFFITTQYMLGQKQLKPAQNYGVPSNYYAIKNADYCSNTLDTTTCSSVDWMQATSEDEAAAVYASLFGEKPTSFESPTSICGTLSHDAEYHIYYTNMAGCGGGDGPIHQAYIEQYMATNSKAYIYIHIASVNVYDGDNVPVYKTFIGLADIHNSETDQAITPDESLVYSRLGSGGVGMVIPKIIDSENYTQFQQYRFVFEKDDDGNYFFKTVEKL